MDLRHPRPIPAAIPCHGPQAAAIIISSRHNSNRTIRPLLLLPVRSINSEYFDIEQGFPPRNSRKFIYPKQLPTCEPLLVLRPRNEPHSMSHFMAILRCPSSSPSRGCCRRRLQSCYPVSDCLSVSLLSAAMSEWSGWLAGRAPSYFR